MTVKVMAGEAAVQPVVVPVPEVPSREGSERELYAEPEVTAAGEDIYVSRRSSRRRRARGSFADVLFVQLILSVLLAGGVWSGLTFGGEEVREICVGIMKLFG